MQRHDDDRPSSADVTGDGGAARKKSAGPAAAGVAPVPESDRSFRAMLDDRIFRLGAGFIGFILVVCWIGLGAGYFHESAESLELRKQELRRLSYTVSEHVRATLDGADQAIRYARRELQLHGELPLSDTRGGMLLDPLFQRILVTDRNGRITATTIAMSEEKRKSVDLSDRRHFRQLQASTEDIFVIGRTGVGRVSGGPSIPIGRKVIARDGSFDGTITIAFPPHYFTTVQRKMDLPRGASVTIIGRDGFVRTHLAPDGTASFGQEVTKTALFNEALVRPEGLVSGESVVRRQKGIIAFRSVPGYDLVVTLSVPQAVYEEEALEAFMFDLGVGIFLTIACLVALRFFHREVAHRRDVVAALRRHEARLIAANETKDRLVASVSHELRTPLTSVLGYAKLITRSAESEEVQEFGHHVHASALHLRDLVNSMLDLAKIDEGKLQAVFEVVDLKPALEETVELFRIAAEEKQLALSLEVDGSAPMTVITDRTRLTQMVSNLVNNAIKFTVRGEVRVVVTGETDHYVIRVQDTGIGISPEQVDRLFSRFSNVEARDLRSMQGAGLGLALVRELAAMLGGAVSVSSEPGVGSTFQLRLPRVPPEARVAGGGDER